MSGRGTDELDEALGDLLERDVPIGPLTTYRVGGSARRFVRAEDERALRRVADGVAASGVEVLVVGRGSNMLVSDAGFDGLAVQLGAGFADVAVTDTVVRAGGGASMPVVARRSAREGLTGFEWAVGVPGSIGGGVRMNAGGHGSDFAAVLERVRILDLRTGDDRTLDPSDLDLGYRRSNVSPDQVVVWAELGLETGDRSASEAMIGEIVRWRRENQPGGQNAGSVFTNPPGDSAGRLIDTAGGRGLRVGSAEVSTKHANFIQADDGGSADDIFGLMEAVRALVLEVHGITLHPETRLVGFGGSSIGEGSGT